MSTLEECREGNFDYHHIKKMASEVFEIICLDRSIYNHGKSEFAMLSTRLMHLTSSVTNTLRISHHKAKMAIGVYSSILNELSSMLIDIVRLN